MDAAMAAYDVAILGGGPAGSLTAALVRRQDPGRRVLVLEREKFPRHHVGESTIPSWRPILERAGVLGKLEPAIPIRKVGGRFLWGRPESESWTLDFRDREDLTRGARLHVDRGALDQLLLEHARSLGAEVHEQARVTAVDREPGAPAQVRWDGPGGAGEALADHVVDASGQARLLSRLWKIPAVPYDGMNNVAVWAYWKGSRVRQGGGPLGERDRWTVISTCDDGWAWHIPIAPDLVSVGLVTDAGSLPAGGPQALEALYRRNVAGCPEIGELLDRAQIVRHPLAGADLLTVRDWSYACERVAGDGWMLVGDAALFVDPILSTGLLITANGASMAANALHTLWNEPQVDRALLVSSYDATYRQVGASFHRLARIWYSRNFQRSTWHWEAKRQRLRAGRDPRGETSAEAFFQLCIGSFTDPIEGAFTGPAQAVNLDRPDARIMAANLFSPEERAHLPGAVADADIARPGSEATAREAVGAASAARWRALLGARVRARGCAWSRGESYFTDRTMDRWVRVAFVEVQPEGSSDPVDRLVFPSTAALPEGVLPLLDGQAPLRQAIGRLLRGADAIERAARLASARQQVLRLDFGGLLEVTLAGDADSAPALPPPVRAALERAPDPWALDVDLPGETLTLRRARDGAQVHLGREPSAAPAYARTATTRLWYQGRDAAEGVAPLLDALASGLRAWERADPAAAARFWDEDLLGLADPCGAGR